MERWSKLRRVAPQEEVLQAIGATVKATGYEGASAVRRYSADSFSLTVFPPLETYSSLKKLPGFLGFLPDVSCSAGMVQTEAA